jgi:multisubunit Na+/H+ antiporter MnhF subunit
MNRTEFESHLRHMAEENALRRRRLDWVSHIVALSIILAALLSCFYILLSGRYIGDLDLVAVAGISFIVTAFIAYLIRRPSK